MKTFSAKPDSVRRDWYLVNAEGKNDVVANQDQVDDLLASLGF